MRRSAAPPAPLPASPPIPQISQLAPPRPRARKPPTPFGKPPPPRQRRKRARPPLTAQETEKRLARHRQDWFRILSELQAVGFTNSDVARVLRLSDSTIRNWKYGAEPTHSRGEALLTLHARLTYRRGRPRMSKRQKPPSGAG